MKLLNMKPGNHRRFCLSAGPPLFHFAFFTSCLTCLRRCFFSVCQSFPKVCKYLIGQPTRSVFHQAHCKDELYPLPLDSGEVLKFRQLQAGEVTGLGTGATVWPAAHVLAKYLERRFPNVGAGEGRRGMEGLRAVDLGSGTGVAGIVAASLGAEAFLTDQEQLLFLMEENADKATRAQAGKPKEKAGTGTTASAKNTNAEAGALGEIHVLTYDWGMDDDQLSPPVDVVLVSDCVLPKLYPIEPLVDAIDRLSGPDTVTIMSYEHRHYQAFDPRRRFEELAAAKGLVKVDIPQARQHPIFSADDIEIWEVRRRQQQAQQSRQAGDCCQLAQRNSARAQGATGSESVLVEMPRTERDVAILSYLTTASPLALRKEAAAGLSAAGEVKHEVQTVVKILGERHELTQAPSGAIGCYLWPSAVVMARHLVAVAAPAAADAPNASDAPGDGDGSPPDGTAPAGLLPCGKVLELGSGVGLVAMTAALLGWEVVSTDKADALPLLQFNVNRCLSSTKRELWLRQGLWKMSDYACYLKDYESKSPVFLKGNSMISLELILCERAAVSYGAFACVW